MSSSLKGVLAIRVFLSFAFAYFLSYAFRSVNAVIGPELRVDLSLSNADLGLLSAAYFLTFAAMQLPLGVWLDKYGPRRTESALLLVAAAGSAIFAMSETAAGLWTGRALIGVGVSGCLMAPFKAYRLWFPAERQAQLASWMLVAGTSGALASTVPVSAAMPIIGWRGVFWVMCAMILAASAAIFFLLKRIEREHPAPVAAPSSTPVAGATYASIFGNPFFRRMAILGAINLASFSALQTLWAGPWMVTVLGMEAHQSANVLFMFNLVLLCAYLVLGWWAPRHVSYGGGAGIPALRVVAIGIGLAILVQFAIIAFTGTWSWMLWILLALCLTMNTLAATAVSLHFPPASAGRANSSFNLTQFAGTFIVQWGIGLLIDAFGTAGASSVDAMRLAFAVCAGVQALALAAFLLAGRRSA
ncbi:MAG TPA: MFS transporter [Noviherbaspirillum sp.]|nr:MFS transporter [Noviherbaspirillum sp.]